MSRPASRSKRRARQDSETLILTAAEALFAEHGFKGASMAMIAVRAGLPKANLHYYFGSKQALYRAVLERILRCWQGSLEHLGSEDEPGEALGRYIREKLEFSWRNPVASRVFAMEVISGGARLKELFNDEFRDWFAARAAVLRFWAAAGKIDPIEPFHLIFLLWSSTQHYADFAMQVGGTLGPRESTAQGLDGVCATLTAIILKGCGARLAEGRQSQAVSPCFSSNLAATGTRLGME